jgi:pimeloyl-ACP methyl ester carboxylesterase
VSGAETTTLGDTAAAWAATQRVEVAGRALRFRAAGAGPAVVLVHGLAISADYWFRNAPQVAAQGFAVWAPDLPGFGRTEGPAEGLTIDAQAEALVAWGEVMGIGAAVYVGHSIGCQSVLELAARRPDRVRGLVLAGPTGAPGSARQAWGLFRDAWREPAELFPLVAQAYLRAGPQRFWKTWRASARHDPVALLARVRAPGLVVVGRNDPVVIPEFAELLAEGLRGRVEWIPGAAHAVIFDQPDAFNRLTVDFARSLPPPAAP